MWSKKSNDILILAAVCMAVAGASAGVTAAYLSRSPGEVQNVITVGSVKGELTEEHWNPELGKTIYPGQSIDKDPAVKNVGDNDAYVFLEVQIPVETIALVDKETNRKTEKRSCELFSFQADEENWKKINDEVSRENARYTYGYKTVLKPGETTEPLFEQVTAVDYLEGELEDSRDYGVHVTAKVIQSNMDEKELDQIYREFVKQYENDVKGGMG